MDAMPPELIALPPPRPGIDAYSVLPSADRATAARILESLPSDCCLGFYDATEHPTGPDPGTYLRMRRRGEVWQITGGNHGWSHGVAEITNEQAIAFLHYCFQSNAGPCPDCITVQKDAYPHNWESPWPGNTLHRRIRKIVGEKPKWWEKLLGLRGS